VNITKGFRQLACECAADLTGTGQGPAASWDLLYQLILRILLHDISKTEKQNCTQAYVQRHQGNIKNMDTPGITQE
jgi:hypothetical protein